MQKIFYSALICSSLALIIFSNSRANYLGIILAVFAAILLKFPLWNKNNVKWFWAAAFFMIPFVGILLFLFYDTIYNMLIFQKNSDNIRIALIINGLNFLKDTIGFGVGAGNIETYMSVFGKFHTGHISNMHNLWFEILSAFGIFVFVPFLFGYINLIYCFLKKYILCNKTNKKNAKIMVCLLVSFIFSCMSSSSLISATWIWGIFGLVLAIKNNINLLQKESQI